MRTNTFKKKVSYSEVDSSENIRGDIDVSTINSTPQYRDEFVTRDNNYPDWRYRLAHGEQSTTYLTGMKYTVSAGTFELDRQYHYNVTPNPFWASRRSAILSGNDLHSGVDFGPYLGQFPGHAEYASDTNAYNRAISGFVRRVHESTTAYEGIISFGQLGKVLHQIRHPANALVQGLGKYLSSLRKARTVLKRVPHSKRLSVAKRIISQTWLEYAYGVRPTLRDLDGSMHALADLQTRSSLGGEFVHFLGTDEASGAVPGSHSWNGIAYKYTRLWKETSFFYLYGATAVQSISNAAGRYVGINPGNLLPSVWELIPYSFLVDYFVNINEILTAAASIRGLLAWVSYVKGVKYQSHIGSIRTYGDTSNSLLYTTSYAVGGEQTSTVSGFTRDVFVGDLVPGIVFTIPGFHQAINISALLGQSRSLVPFHRV